VKNFSTGYKSRFFWLAVFAVAMGFLEGIVVIYLRELYYPEGFDFPVKLMSPELVRIEWIREISTLIMLAAVGIIAGRNNIQRLLYSLFAFGVWDIFYYIALKIMIGWPASLLTWDLLFLIPWSWVGPVLAPVINSLTMIFMAVFIVRRDESASPVKPQPIDMILILSGAVIILYTYLIDHLRLIIDSDVIASEKSPDASDQFIKMLTSFVPDSYNWPVFIFGELLIISAILKILIQSKKRMKRPSQ